MLDTEHVTITRTEEKLGLNSSATNDLAVDTVVDADRLLGELHHGFRIAMATLDGGRIGIAAQAVGIAQAATTSRARTRTSGTRSGSGSPTSRRSSTAREHVDGDRRGAAARLPRRVAEGQGRPHTEAGAKAKLFASEMARRQTAEAIQVLGGYGYTKEFPVERYYRDAKVTEIYEGTSEIQRLVIAREFLGRRRSHRRSTANVRRA